MLKNAQEIEKRVITDKMIAYFTPLYPNKAIIHAYIEYLSANIIILMQNKGVNHSNITSVFTWANTYVTNIETNNANKIRDDTNIMIKNISKTTKHSIKLINHASIRIKNASKIITKTV